MAIITGGAGNLGAHASRLFVAEGAMVVINDINAEKATALADELGVVFDLTDYPPSPADVRSSNGPSSNGPSTPASCWRAGFR